MVNFRMLFFILLIISQSLIYSASAQTESIQSKQSTFPFQKIIWSYWGSHIQQAPYMVQVCQYKMQKQAEQAGWVYHLVNQTNAHTFISNYEQRFTRVRKNSKQQAVAQFDADLVRFLLLQEHGGLWIDISSFLLNRIQDLNTFMDKKYHHLITNKFSPQPQILLVYFCKYQNRIEYKVEFINEKKQVQSILYNQFPGQEIFFIGVKKGSKMIKQILFTYSLFTQLGWKQADTYMNIIDYKNYLIGNMAIIYVLQQKQKQLDNKQLKLFQPRKTAFEYYMLWSVHGEVGPLVHQRTSILQDEAQFFTRTQQQIQSHRGMFFLQVKFTGWLRVMYQNKLKVLAKAHIFNILNNNQDDSSFNNFLKSKPDIQKCKDITFIVKDSIADRLFRDSPFLQILKIRPISKSQNQQWVDYCYQLKRKEGQYGSLIFGKYRDFGGFWYYLINGYGERTKVSQIINYGKQQNLYESISNWRNDNNHFIRFSGIIVTGIALFILLAHKIFNCVGFYLDNHIIYKANNNGYESAHQLSPSSLNTVAQSQQFRQEAGIVKNNNLSIVHEQLKVNKSENNKQEYLYFGIERDNQNDKVILLFIAFIISIISFYLVDITGGRDQGWTILLYIIIIYGCLIQAEKQLNHLPLIILNNKPTSETQSFYSSLLSNQSFKYFYQLLYLSTNFITIYLFLTVVRYHQFRIIYLATLMGMIWPCLIRFISLLGKSQKSQHSSASNHHLIIQSISTNILKIVNNNYHRYFILIILLILNLLPNLKYLTIDQDIYLWSQITWIIPNLFTILMFGMCFYLLQSQLRHHKHQQPFTMKWIILRLVQLVYLLLITTAIYLAIQQKMYMFFPDESRVFYLINLVALVNGIYVQITYPAVMMRKINTSQNGNNQINTRQLIYLLMVPLLQLTIGSLYLNFEHNLLDDKMQLKLNYIIPQLILMIVWNVMLIPLIGRNQVSAREQRQICRQKYSFQHEIIQFVAEEVGNTNERQKNKNNKIEQKEDYNV